jgi:hypothetical protein
MERTYRLEFSENQQKFHLDNYTHIQNSNGYITIFDCCTDNEFKAFESFVNRIYKKKLTANYVLMCASEMRLFTKNLLEYGLTIKK